MQDTCLSSKVMAASKTHLALRDPKDVPMTAALTTYQ